MQLRAAAAIVESFGFCGGNAHRTPNDLITDGVGRERAVVLAHVPVRRHPVCGLRGGSARAHGWSVEHNRKGPAVLRRAPSSPQGATDEENPLDAWGFAVVVVGLLLGGAFAAPRPTEGSSRLAGFGCSAAGRLCCGEHQRARGPARGPRRRQSARHERRSCFLGLHTNNVLAKPVTPLSMRLPIARSNAPTSSSRGTISRSPASPRLPPSRHRFGEARRFARRALAVNPYAAGAWGILGDAEVETGTTRQPSPPSSAWSRFDRRPPPTRASRTPASFWADRRRHRSDATRRCRRGRESRARGMGPDPPRQPLRGDGSAWAGRAALSPRARGRARLRARCCRTRPDRALAR